MNFHSRNPAPKTRMPTVATRPSAKPTFLIKFRANPNIDDVFIETTDPVHIIQSCDGNEVEYVIDLERGNVTDYVQAEVESRSRECV